MTSPVRATNVAAPVMLFAYRCAGHGDKHCARRKALHPHSINDFVRGGAVAAYWISRCKINDPVECKKYTDRVPEIIARYGSKVLAI